LKKEKVTCACGCGKKRNKYGRDKIVRRYIRWHAGFRGLHTQEAKDKIRLGRLGKKQSEEHNAAIARSWKFRKKHLPPHSEETRNNISIGVRRWHASKKIAKRAVETREVQKIVDGKIIKYIIPCKGERGKDIEILPDYIRNLYR
jgi:hypothetical protein